VAFDGTFKLTSGTKPSRGAANEIPAHESLLCWQIPF
jgi:hypothetical protein